jgi:pimeloyl-ACP methyl ester carboxylesterase
VQAEAYGLQEAVADLAALLDLLDIEKAVFIGHDWSAPFCLSSPLLTHTHTCTHTSVVLGLACTAD